MICLFLYAHKHQEVIDKVKVFWPKANFEKVGADDYDTWEVFKEYWNKGEDLVLIEQHKLIHDDVKWQFLECSNQWCVFPHELVLKGNWVKSSLGCVRWRKELQAEVSIEEMEEYHRVDLKDHAHTQAYRDQGVCWGHIETVTNHCAFHHGYYFHNHWPGVRHWCVYHGRESCHRDS